MSISLNFQNPVYNAGQYYPNTANNGSGTDLNSLLNYNLGSTQNTQSLFGGLNQLNSLVPQQTQMQQNSMMQFFQMMMQMFMQMMGINPQQGQQQAIQPQQIQQPSFLPQQPQIQQAQSQQDPLMQLMQQMMQMLGINPQQQQAQQNINTQGFPVAQQTNNNGGATASAAAGPGGAAASAAAGPNGASASAAANGNGKTSTSENGKPDFKSMSNDELQEYWNKHKDKESGKEIHDRAKTKDNKTSDGKSLHDPYEVNINGEKYVFVQDKNKNGQVDGEKEFLGFNDTKDNLFNGMKKLDSNKDGKISKAEMDAQGVKLQKVDANGKLTSQAKDVQEVDLNTFKANQNFNGKGEAGSFDVKLADGQNVKAKEIFETMEKLKSYFN